MKKVALVIRDGWGYRKNCNLNSICESKIPFTKSLMKEYPNSLIKTSGEDVGLPKGYQGNSEVGHMTIGSGRIMFQSLERINKSIKEKDFFNNKAILKAINNCIKKKSNFHIMGLMQTQGVHSHLDHLFAILDLCKIKKLKDVYIHLITDGRDSPIHESLKNLKLVETKLKKLRFGKIASICGRFYAMDRDERWDRTKKAYECIVNANADSFTNVKKQIKECHKNNESDEFIVPRKLNGYLGIDDKDSIMFFNFRTDRTRQLTKAIVEDKFKGWKRKPKKSCFVAMTKFYDSINALIAFCEIKTKNTLGEIISQNKLNQLRISETEKYAHVTFFFNAQEEKPFKNEDRILVHSPKVLTYDLKPEMSAKQVTKKLVEEINKNKYQLIVVNLVNADMVGHTGITKACHKAAETVDLCLKKIVISSLKKDYSLLICADHGNLEDQTKKWNTSHTINPVPLIYVSKDKNSIKLKNGGLKDIAPTILKLLDIKQPKEMKGECLLKWDI